MRQRSLWMWALLILGVAAACLWAQADTPIIVGDGSLYIRSEVPWSRFAANGNARVHPDAGKAITTVEIVMPNHNANADCARQQCTVSIRYGNTDIVFASGADGKGLRFTTDHSAFHAGSNEKEIAHNDAHSKISSVVVKRGQQTLFTGNASGGTKVTIHYQ